MLNRSIQIKQLLFEKSWNKRIPILKRWRMKKIFNPRLQILNIFNEIFEIEPFEFKTFRILEVDL